MSLDAPHAVDAGPANAESPVQDAPTSEASRPAETLTSEEVEERVAGYIKATEGFLGRELAEKIARARVGKPPLSDYAVSRESMYE